MANLQIKEGISLYLQRKRSKLWVYMLSCLLKEVAKMEKIRSLVFLHYVAVTEKEIQNASAKQMSTKHSFR